MFKLLFFLCSLLVLIFLGGSFIDMKVTYMEPDHAHPYCGERGFPTGGFARLACYEKQVAMVEKSKHEEYKFYYLLTDFGKEHKGWAVAIFVFLFFVCGLTDVLIEEERKKAAFDPLLSMLRREEWQEQQRLREEVQQTAGSDMDTNTWIS